MAGRATLVAVLPWVWRILIAAAILAAPIIIFKAFTDPDTPDPNRRVRLGEVQETNRPRPDTPPAPPNSYRP